MKFKITTQNIATVNSLEIMRQLFGSVDALDFLYTNEAINEDGYFINNGKYFSSTNLVEFNDTIHNLMSYYSEAVDDLDSVIVIMSVIK